jgi:hypothetical protein
MRRIIDYRLITSLERTLKLESLVREAIAEGWQPECGVTTAQIVLSFDPSDESTVWVQTVVKYE